MNLLDNIIGVEEAAEILNLSPGTVKNKCAAGELPSKKIGKTWILDKTNLKTKETATMKKLNVTKMNGRLYKLPEGYYAIDGRFGDQVYNKHGENVTQKIMANAQGTGYIILADSGNINLDLQ